MAAVCLPGFYSPSRRFRPRLFCLLATLSCGLCLLGTATSAHALIEDGCIGDLFDEFGNGGGLTCTAEDVTIASVSNVVVLDDGCTSVGDTLTMSLDAQVLLNAQARHDIGLYLGTGGSALFGSCAIEVLDLTTDLDGTGDGGTACSVDPEEPCNVDADCQLDLDGDGLTGGTCVTIAPGTTQDTCGDIDAAPNPLYQNFASVTIQCTDSNGDGSVDLPNCTSWRQPGANELCLSPLYAYPGAPSKCKCGIVETGVFVPNTIEVVKDLVPDADPGLFDLQVDGAVQASDVGDGGTTGKVTVAPGPHTVGETAGTGTSLISYGSSISCVDGVGRCVGSPAIACTDDFFCDILDNDVADGSDTCDLTPRIVASCSNCTSVPLEVPVVQSVIVCTITNEQKCVQPCDDGEFCNGTETCDPGTGQCLAGVPPDCSDGVSCTTDTCDEVGDQCVHAPDDGLCDDGAYCNGVETCDAVADCQPGTAIDCADAVSCTVDVCDEGADQCVNTPDDGLCNDGQFCNGAETCDAVGGCQAGAAPSCADAVSCTTDACDEVGDQCTHVPDDGLCSDGQFCNGAETCDPFLGCQAGVPPSCDDAVSCTTDACDAVGGQCTHVPSDGACNDGQFCNGIETCDPVGGCQAGAAPNCADGVSCTTDGCDEVGDQCTHVPSDAACNDGQFCNGVETCDVAAGCQAGSAPTCDDGVSCTADVCDDGIDACTYLPDDGACQDGTVCTTDSCDLLLGCQHAVDLGLCGDPCAVGVTKGTSSVVIAAPADVTFTFSVTNDTLPARDVTLGTLSDDVLGDLSGQGDCMVPQTIASGDTYTCSVVDTLVGLPGDVHDDVVTAEAVDSVNGSLCSDQADAHIDFAFAILPACRHPCHARIKFRQALGKSTNPDFFRMNGSLDLPPDIDLSTMDFSLTISNQNGVVYSESLPPGALQGTAAKVVYKDNASKKTGGIALLKVWRYKVLDNWRFKIKAFGDLSAATEEEMTVTIRVGSYTFVHTDVWDALKKGWQLRFNL